MSNKNKTAPAVQFENDEPEQAVASKPRFIFQAYQDNTGAVDESEIEPYLNPGVVFDYEQWAPAWKRYDQISDVHKDYYVVVRAGEQFSELFSPESFDPIHGVIGRGKDKLHPSLGGIPELYLCIRPREADVEEERQMSRASARRLEDNEKLKEIKKRSNGVVGAEMFGGVSMSRTGWGDN